MSDDGPVLWYIRKVKHWRASGKAEFRPFSNNLFGCIYRRLQELQFLQKSLLAVCKGFYKNFVRVPRTAQELIAKADRHEALREQILRWRDEAAVRLRLAPAAVLSEHSCLAPGPFLNIILNLPDIPSM